MGYFFFAAFLFVPFFLVPFFLVPFFFVPFFFAFFLAAMSRSPPSLVVGSTFVHIIEYEEVRA